jgi:hypothetical protein
VFEYWFGIDLNEPVDQGSAVGSNESEAGTSGGHHSWQHPDEIGTRGGYSTGQYGDATLDPMDTSERATNDGSGSIGVTLSSEDSGDEGEVQSTSEGLAQRLSARNLTLWKQHCDITIGMHIMWDLLSGLNHQGSQRKDGEKDKSLFVCNKTWKNGEPEPTPIKHRNHTITKLADCKAKMRIKRVGARWDVTQFVEGHTHELIEKFALNKYLTSHNKIRKEEKNFFDLLHEVNLSSGRIMEIGGTSWEQEECALQCKNNQ